MNGLKKRMGGGHEWFAGISAFVKIASAFTFAAILFGACVQPQPPVVIERETIRETITIIERVVVEKVTIDGTTYNNTTEYSIGESGQSLNAPQNQKTEDGGTSASTEPVTNWDGAFKDKSAEIPSFIMGAYEVTQELYQAVMGELPKGMQPDEGKSSETTKTTKSLTEDEKSLPVVSVTWYEAVAFCNTLTEKTDIKGADGKPDYAYYTDESYQTPYKGSESGESKSNESVTIYWKKESKGYRLPTEAEWEFAARGGDPSAKEWDYQYAGEPESKPWKQPEGSTEDSDYESGWLVKDANLDKVAWYYSNSSVETTSGETKSSNQAHKVGTKNPNTLKLYDMSGNVGEWCWDEYKKEKATSTERVYRGGSFVSYPSGCAVFCRYSSVPTQEAAYLGFRVCRTQ